MKKAMEAPGIGVIVTIIVILIVAILLILFATGNLQKLFHGIEQVSPEEEEVNVASCIIACNKDKSIARNYETCTEFRDSYFNDESSKFCKSCIGKVDCDIKFGEDEDICYCKTTGVQPAL